MPYGIILLCRIRNYFAELDGKAKATYQCLCYRIKKISPCTRDPYSFCLPLTTDAIETPPKCLTLSWISLGTKRNV